MNRQSASNHHIESTRRSIDRFRTCVLLLLPVMLSVLGPRLVSRSNVAPPALATGVDPNNAPWWELAALPDFGDKTARAVVDYRTSKRKSAALAPSAPVFVQPSDLDRVPGIGPKTVQRIAKHLTFSSAP